MVVEWRATFVGGGDTVVGVEVVAEVVAEAAAIDVVSCAASEMWLGSSTAHHQPVQLPPALPPA